MNTPRNDSLEKVAGNLMIAWGVVSFPIALATGTLDCSAIFIIWAGIAVRRGSRTGSFFALIFSAIGFVAAVALVVSAATHGIAEVGGVRTIAAAGFAVWMLLNMALLSELRRWPSPAEFSHSSNEDAPLADESLPEPVTEAAGEAGSDVKLAPVATSHRRLPQFSLRSLFVLAILVALGCALGTRPIPPSRTWNSCWGGTAGKDAVLWSVHVVGSPSGVPAIGFLWHSQGKTARSPECFHASTSPDFRLNGQPVTPGRQFILFYNDAEDKPQRLEISKEEATKVFGDPLNMSRIEKFWKETIEPLRKSSGGQSGAP